MTEKHDPNQLMDVAPDIAPLAWVIDEIRVALTQALEGLKTFLGAKQDLDTLRNASSQVHQAHGALQLLDLRGVALVTEAMEQLLRRWENEPRECGPSAVRSLETATAALIAYLEGLLSGRPNQPIRLFPYYREVLTLTQAPRVHPADLIFPDLTRRPAFHQIEARPLTTDQLRVRRVRFEEGLLGFLRDSDSARARQQMRDALADLEQMPQRGLARSFWWVVRGLLEALQARKLAVDTDLKRVLARLNLQLRRMIEGGAAVAERLMTDALYYVGRAEDGTPRVAEVKRLYGLEALIPPDFERATLTTIDAEALRLIKEASAHAKTLWGPIVSGAGDAAKFASEIEQARGAAARLQARDLEQILAAIGAVSGEYSRLAANVRESLGLEVASALLFADLGIDALPRHDDEYGRRAHAVIERLRAAYGGGKLPDSAPWLSALARRAQDRLTMGTVVAETQTTLREIEQRLDRFFRNPNERGDLAATDAMFDQVCGVLALLGHEEPVAAMRSVQQSVRKFAQPGSPSAQQEFAHVAGNLGAIGFFIESLGQDAERPRGMFHYDPGTGAFSADLTQSRSIEAVPAPDDALPVQHVAEPTAASRRAENVEQSASVHRQQVKVLAERLASHPEDRAALDRLAQLVPLLANEADLLDNAPLKERTAQAAVLLTQFASQRETRLARDLAALFAATELAAMPEPTAPLPETEDAADRELHEIFVEEANEVLQTVETQLQALHAEPSNSSTLTTVRRAFHTLKGSSRMVGLKQFGEGAWAIEQCFNLWLAQERPASEDLLRLARTAHQLMQGWIKAIAANPRAAIDVGALVSSAQRVREGAPFEFAGAAPPPKLAGSAATEAPLALPVERGAQTPAAAPALEAASNEAPGAQPVVAVDDEIKRIGPIEISHGLYSVFLNEADEGIRTLAQDFAEWRFEPGRTALPSSVRRAHSLAGTTATVGLLPVRALADPLDELIRELNRRALTGASLSPAQFDTIERAIERMRGMLHEFAAGIYPDEAPHEASALHDLLRVLRTQSTAAQIQIAATTLAPPARVATDRPVAAAPIAGPVEEIEMPPAPDVDVSFELVRQTAAESVDEAPALELPELIEEDAASSTSTDRGLRAFVSTVSDELDADLLPVFLTEAHDLLPAVGAGLRALGGNPNDRDAARELMRQLHTVKGSARMAGAMRLGELVHDMETRIESAMQLVNVPQMIVEDLQSQYDQAMHLFDRLQHPAAVPTPTAETKATEPPAALAPVFDLATARAETPSAPAPAPKLTLPAAATTASAATTAAATPAATASFIRVRADVLDKLVDQAGEVSIARSKLENEIGTLKSALTDLTENITRLRGQLREMEVQADAQISARADQLSKESATFDPLEFDRYTRLQELTRQLAESVEDVAMVQNTMLKGLQLADTDLTTQSRLTRDLQQQLMRVRLVPFSSIAERLYRVARQASKELDKRVNLEIRGGNAEIDRGVLERMSGPFEHLVRNAIVHGVEPPARRINAGKPETGELTIEVRQQGNEIIVVVADDGSGLDMQRIRARGVEKNLLGMHQVTSDRELMELIFAPGFTTATEVTELAGRGVGMDVVRSELSSFGGRIAVASEAGKGTRFTLYLPLTLAVTQVVLVKVGGRRYAIPAGIVEQVRRYKPHLIAPMLGEGTIQLPPVGDVVLRPLAQLLGEDVVPHHAKQTPVVLLRAGDDRLAVAVDDLSSNQEVVVKNVGAQVSRLAGILGATILGSGEIVLIINPVQLITRAPEPPAVYSAPELSALSASDEAARARARLAAAAGGIEAPAVVMVVDDSLTVRRVTQRLLERNGYDVLLAKDGVDALRQLQDVRPDAMLVDIEMPRMDGFDLTRNVRAAAATRDIPILMITSRTAEKHRSLAFQIGVNEYLGKPYQEAELLGHLNRYLAARAIV